LIEDKRNDLTIVEGNPGNGKYIIRRLKLTGNDQSNHNGSEESGFYIAFRPGNDKDWTFSENKHHFESAGDDYKNDLDSIVTEDEIIKGRNRGNGDKTTEDSRQEGSELYQSSDESAAENYNNFDTSTIDNNYDPTGTTLDYNEVSTTEKIDGSIEHTTEPVTDIATTVYVDDHYDSDEDYLESRENQKDNSHGSKEIIVGSSTK
jgi:hypothetical protein